MWEYRSILSVLKSRVFIAFIVLAVTIIVLYPFALANNTTSNIVTVVGIAIAIAAVALARRSLMLIGMGQTMIGKIVNAMVVMFIAFAVLALPLVFIKMALPYIPIHRYRAIITDAVLGIYTTEAVLMYATITTGVVALVYVSATIYRALHRALRNPVKN